MDSLIRRRPAGFTLIETIIVLAILSILIGTMIAVGLPIIESSRQDAVRKSTRAIAVAILGDPAKNALGYVGDIGDLPDALGDLITKPVGFPDYNTSNTNKVGMGWRGPYVDRGFFPGDEFKDEWGTLFEYGGKTGTGGGRTGRGQIRSGGPDKALGTSDDIVYPLGTVETNGTVLVTVYVNDIPNPQGVTVTVYKTSNGAEAIHATQSTGVGFTGFSFSVHQAVHAVKASHTSEGTTVERTENVTVIARNQHHLAIRLRTTATVTM